MYLHLTHAHQYDIGAEWLTRQQQRTNGGNQMRTKHSVMKNQIIMAILGATAGLLWTSCGTKGDDPWGMPIPRMTGITPVVGQYAFDQQGNFSVIQKTNGQLYVRFSSDRYRYDEIKIVNGAFQWWHGSIGGTHCPTDSYAITGSSVTATQAEGTIKYAYDCQIIGSYHFVATLVSAEPTRTPSPVITSTKTPTATDVPTVTAMVTPSITATP